MSAEGSPVYAVSSGSWSNYFVHCIFESRKDALTYARRLAEMDLLSTHNRMIALSREPGPSRGLTPHTDPREACELCARASVSIGTQDTAAHGYPIEEFQFYSDGNVPIAEAESV
jgi:hypothetical protein